MVIEKGKAILNPLIPRLKFAFLSPHSAVVCVLTLLPPPQLPFPRRTAPQLQALAHETPLGLKIADERVCAEQRQRLVQDVVRLAVGIDVEVAEACGERGRLKFPAL